MSSRRDSSPLKPRPWGIWFTLSLTILITGICAAVIWYQFIVTPETNCIIMVGGNEEFDGYTVEVVPKVAADPDRARLSVELSKDNSYDARFFLSSGTYQMRVLRPDGATVVDITDFVPPGRRWTYDLNRAKASPGGFPSTRPAATR